MVEMANDNKAAALESQPLSTYPEPPSYDEATSTTGTTRSIPESIIVDEAEFVLFQPPHGSGSHDGSLQRPPLWTPPADTERARAPLRVR